MVEKKIPVGILGATGVVGQRFVQMLENHPWFEVAWLAASERSDGRPYVEAARWRLKTAIPPRVAEMQISAAKPDGAPKVVFAALDASIAAELEPWFAEAGHCVISNSSALRMHKEVPLIIPEVNADQERQCQAKSDPLGAQKNDFRERHKHRDDGQHDGGNARRHTLLGPEQQSVVEDEDEHRKQE